MPTIAYLANLFPSPVEPYVVDEIEELRRVGIAVVPCSIRRQRSAPGSLQAIAAETLYLPDLHFSALLRAVWLCVTNLTALCEFLWQALTGGGESFNRRVRAVSHTLLGIYCAAVLETRGVEHIHVHHGYFGSWVGMVAARMLNAGFSLTLHGSDLLLHGAFLGLKIERCAFCLTISEFNRSYILTRCPAADPAKISLCRVGVDDVPPGTPAEKPHDSTFSILSVGRLHPVKNHAFLIQACWLMKCRGLKFSCRIAGGGPERRHLEGMIHDFGLLDEVRLLGQLSREQIDHEYRRADLVVLTSHSEGIPLVLMEAMVRRRVVLAPAITGIPELISDGETGFLYQSGSLNDFLARVELAMNTRTALGPLAEAARKQVLKHFNRKTNLAAVASVFATHFQTRSHHASSTPPETLDSLYENSLLQ